MDFELIAAVGDGRLLWFALGGVVGVFVGWNIPSPPWINKLMGKK